MQDIRRFNDRVQHAGRVASTMTPPNPVAQVGLDLVQSVADVEGAVHHVDESNAAREALAATGQPFDLADYLSQPEFVIPKDAMTRAQLVESLYKAIETHEAAQEAYRTGAENAYAEAATRTEGLADRAAYLKNTQQPDGSLAEASRNIVNEHSASTLGRLGRNLFFGIPETIGDATGLLPDHERQFQDQLQDRFSPNAATLGEVGGQLGTAVGTAILGLGGRSALRRVRGGKSGSSTTLSQNRPRQADPPVGSSQQSLEAKTPSALPTFDPSKWSASTRGNIGKKPAVSKASRKTAAKRPAKQRAEPKNVSLDVIRSARTALKEAGVGTVKQRRANPKRAREVLTKIAREHGLTEGFLRRQLAPKK